MCVNCSFSPKREFDFPAELKRELDNFLEPMRTKDFLDSLVDLAQMPRDFVEYKLRVCLNEVYVGVDLIWDDLIERKPSSILEVGAGSKLVSYFLKQKGFDVIALEPFQDGFGFYESVWKLTSQQFAHINLKTIPLYAEELDPQNNGYFDYMFSVNVLEHIHKFEEAIQAMKSVLNKGGAMRHTCPNYNIPYEVHFGIPLLPFTPITTRHFFQKKIAKRQDVWDSLNFITYTRTKKALNKFNLESSFTTGLTYEAFERLGADPVFQERHGKTIAGKTYKFLKTTKLLKLMKHLPKSHTTPMEFIAYN